MDTSRPVAPAGTPAPSPEALARTEAFVDLMPKVELHVHLEGTLRPETLLDLARKHGVEPPAPNLAGLRAFYAYRDFPHFIDVWLACLSCLRDPSDFVRLTRELGETAAAQRVRYMEVTFTPSTHARHRGLPFDEVLGGIRAGAAEALRDHGVAMRFIPDIPRNLRRGEADRMVELTAELAISERGRDVVALGLGGAEAAHPPELFAEVFAHAKSRGVRAWPHAGETAGPESVRGAVDSLGADRIAHGIRAVEDPDLVALLAHRGIGCDVCPTSNVRLGVYPSVADHPVRRLIGAGVPVTVNSDDPPMFGTTLTGEFLSLARDLAFTPAELADLVRTAVRVSFLPPADQSVLAASVESELTEAARTAGVTL